MDTLMQPAGGSVLSERHPSSEANRAAAAAATRGTKRLAPTTETTKATAATAAAGVISAQKARAAATTGGESAAKSSGNKFGFRPAAAAPAATLAAPQQQQQQAKRRKTEEQSIEHQAHQQQAEDVHMQDALPVSLTSATLEPLLLGPCDSVANLWRDTMMDEATSAECKAAMAVKISASKFDYKEKIGQLEANMKSLRKVVGTLLKKQESFLSDAGRIELGLNEALLREKQALREGHASKALLQGQMNTALQLLKQTQGQRDKLIAEMKSNAAQMSAHASVLAMKDAEVAAVQAKLEQSTKDLGETMAALDSTTLEREEAKKMLVELQSQLDEASVLLAQLEEEKAALVKTCEDQGELLEAGEKKERQMESDMGDVRHQLSSLMTQWSTLQKAHEVSEAQVETLMGRLASLQSELIQAKNDVENGKREMEASQHAFAEARSAHAHEVAQLRAAQQRELESLKTNLTQSTQKNAQEVNDLAHQMDQLAQAKALLQEQYAKAQLDLVAVRSSLLHASDKVSTSEVEVSKLTGELQLVKLQLEKKNEECFVTVNSFAQIQKFHEERQVILQAEKEALEKAKTELMTRAAALESTGKATQASLDQTMATLQERQATLDQLRLDHATLQATSAAEKAQFERQLVEAGEKLQAVTAELTARTAALEAQVTGLTSQLAAESTKAITLHRELVSFKALSGVSNESQMENLVKLSMEAETLRSQVADKGQMAATLVDTQRRLEDALRKVAESELTRRALHNTIQELKGNIRVFTRVRPMFHAGAGAASGAKDANGDVNMAQQQLTGDDAVNAIEVSQDGKKVRLDGGGGGAKSSYTFDAVFGPASTQKEVFDEISPLVQSSLDGYHVCLFSYGQTGAGKSWTMTGSVTGEQRGIIPRSVEKVLEQSQALSLNGWTYVLEASYLEIYNETLRDLLCSNSKESDLDVKRDAAGRTIVPGLTRTVITTINDVAALMHKAAKNRSTASTNMNERSSRSHSVFTLYLSASNPLAKQTLSGSLNLCDLAGSERLSKSGAGADAARLKETQAINKSLSSLSDVFLALSQKSAHVPFRNSKLTFLLASCLSGDGKTAMIVNLNPALSSAGESACTLRFAAQVNQVELGKPKKQAKSGDDAMDVIMKEATSTSAAAGASRPSLSGSSSASNLARPSTATSGLKKPSAIGSVTARPTTGTAMRR